MGIVLMVTGAELGLTSVTSGSVIIARRPMSPVKGLLAQLQAELFEGESDVSFPGHGSHKVAMQTLNRESIEVDKKIWAAVHDMSLQAEPLDVDEDSRIASQILEQLTHGFYVPLDRTISEKYIDYLRRCEADTSAVTKL